MSEYFISPDGKLYHANDDYLQHWKYIKREKVKGKWKYTYKDDLKDEGNKNKPEKESSLTKSVKNMVTNAKNKIDDLLDSADKKVDETVNKAKESVETARKNIEAVKSEVQETVNESVTKTKNTAQGVATKVKDTVDNKVASAKKTRDDVVEFVESTPERIIESVNTTVDKAMPAVNNLIDKLDAKVSDYYSKNMYYTNSNTINEKRERVRNTKEWQDIVARNDPEYVRVKPDGSKEYLIDDYIVKKKHPLLDAVDDIATGRDVSINDISKDSLLASAKEYVDTAQTVLGIVSYGLLFRFKYKQGSYDEEIAAIQDTVNAGAEFISKGSQLAEMTSYQLSAVAGDGTKVNIDMDALGEISMNALNYAINGLDKNTIDKIVNAASQAALSSIATDVTNGVPDTVVKNAAKAAVTTAMGDVSDEMIDDIVDSITQDIADNIERRRREIYGA